MSSMALHSVFRYQAAADDIERGMLLAREAGSNAIWERDARKAPNENLREKATAKVEAVKTSLHVDWLCSVKVSAFLVYQSSRKNQAELHQHLSTKALRYECNIQMTIIEK